MHALSLKQPWATLVVLGSKTIEVRKWPTARRGPILIHAARIPDERPLAWARVPPEGQQAARLLGGIVGSAELTGCRCYRTQEAFAADCSQHLNHPEWFEGPRLYGFTFRNASVLPFHPCPGWMRFFQVESEG
jgi:hypothetical protein